MTLWMHRISHHAEFSTPLLKEHNYLTIGFSDFIPDFLSQLDNLPTEYDFIPKTEQQGIPFLDRMFKQVWGHNDQARYLLYRFFQMGKGDWVVVPEPGKFSVYQVEEDHAHPITSIDHDLIKDWHNRGVKQEKGKLWREDNGNLVELGFVRKVSPVEINIPRSQYADAKLTRKMGFPKTNNDISEAKDNVEKAIHNFQSEKPINIHSNIVGGVKEKILANIRQELNPDKFEQLIKWYFARCGATYTEILPKNESNKEGDADVEARFDLLKTIFYVQAKFHSGTTTAEAADQIIDYVANKAFLHQDDYHRISWVVSTADNFSNEIQRKAAENNVRLINGAELAEMILEAGIHDLDSVL